MYQEPGQPIVPVAHLTLSLEPYCTQGCDSHFEVRRYPGVIVLEFNDSCGLEFETAPRPLWPL
jgi:hypothetical protein